MKSGVCTFSSYLKILRYKVREKQALICDWSNGIVDHAEKTIKLDRRAPGPAVTTITGAAFLITQREGMV